MGVVINRGAPETLYSEKELPLHNAVRELEHILTRKTPVAHYFVFLAMWLTTQLED